MVQAHVLKQTCTFADDHKFTTHGFNLCDFKSHGFNLLELLIALTIVALLTLFALPMYQDHILAAQRLDAKIALMDLSARIEHYYTEHHTYLGATLGAHRPSDLLDSTLTSAGFYKLSILNQSATNYLLQASPAKDSPQARDSLCGSFQLNQSGEKFITGSGTIKQCWGN